MKEEGERRESKGKERKGKERKEGDECPVMTVMSQIRGGFCWIRKR